MVIMEDKRGSIEEVVNVVENVEKKYCEKNSVVEAHTGVLIAKNS